MLDSLCSLPLRPALSQRLFETLSSYSTLLAWLALRLFLCCRYATLAHASAMPISFPRLDTHQMSGLSVDFWPTESEIRHFPCSPFS